jgi:hypothetical protein
MIIGISGVAAAGKTTMADHLVSNYQFQKVSFAGSLKKACKEIFNLSDEQLYGTLKETIDPYWGITPRYILQKVGTECMRNVFDKDIWIKSLGARIANTPNSNYCCDDCRFINELCAIKEWGGKVIKLHRPGAKATGGIEGHSSETELLSFKEWSYVIYNDSTIEDFYRKIDNFMKLVKP